MKEVLELLEKMRLERENAEYKQHLIKAIELTMLKLIKMEVEKLDSNRFEQQVIPKITEENEALKRLCEEWFVKPMIQPYAGANQECLFCGAAYDRNGGVHHSASDCPVIKYNDIKSNFSE